MASSNALLLFAFTIHGVISKSCAVLCGDGLICSGSTTCCGDSCCDQMWNIWWFWIIWVCIFLVMISCGFCCRRQRAARLRREQFLIVQNTTNPAQPYVIQGYGTVGNSECAPILYAAPPGMGGQPVYGYNSTHVPPAYTPATKPPEYTPTA